MAAYAATEGTLTVKRFRVEDYANLRESTGQSSDMTNVPVAAETIAGVEYKLEKLLVSGGTTKVAISTPVDTSFTARTQTTDSRGETTFANLPEGYYLVSETTPSGHRALDGGKFVVQIPNRVRDASGNETSNYDVVVYPKGTKIQVEKTVSSPKQVVGIGDIISWDVVYPMGPDLKREESINGTTITSYGKNFYLTDEMDTRLDYVEGSVSFRYYDIDENEIALTLQEGIDYHLPYDTVNHRLTIAFTDEVGTKKVADANVATIRMHLDTRVNVTALDTVTPLWNNARIVFENASGDPYEHEVFLAGTDVMDSRVPKVYLGQIVVTKVDAADRNIKLAGATFYLADSKANAEAGKFLKRAVDNQGNEEELRITTDENGQATIRTVGAGTYYLVETKAPEGYSKLSEPIEVTVANEGNANVVQVEVGNYKEGTTPKVPENPGENPGKNPGEEPPQGDDNGSGGKGFPGGVKTGDVARMGGLLLLAVASGGIVFSVLRREKEKRREVQE